MRLLLDTCISGHAAEMLRAHSHDVVWTGEWEHDPGDEQILALAFAENRILITLDKDFGELAIVRQRPHSGIIRLVNFSFRLQGTVCLQILTAHSNELESGAIVTAEPGRLRIRPLTTDDD